jgi:hypothetical protein
MLKKPCPYHKTPVNHTLEQCDMLKNTTTVPPRRMARPRRMGVTATPVASPRWRTSSSSSGGQPSICPTPSAKREWHEVLAAEKAPPSFLDWSEDVINFSREDHPNHIPNPGQYPLVVDPVIGNARFSKVLMVGGNSLNILYAHTLRLLGIGLDQLRPSTMPFHGVTPGKRVQTLGQIDLPV